MFATFCKTLQHHWSHIYNLIFIYFQIRLVQNVKESNSKIFRHIQTGHNCRGDITFGTNDVFAFERIEIIVGKEENADIQHFHVSHKL